MNNTKTNFSEEIKLIRSSVRSWKNLQEEEIAFERLPGLSNLIYKVSSRKPHINPPHMIYRQFGEGVVDRGQDNYIFKEISRSGLGPKCYYANQTCRIEEFLNGKSPVSDEMRERYCWRTIAKSLGGLHCLKLSKLEKTPLVLKLFKEEKTLNEFRTKCGKAIFSDHEIEIIQEIKNLSEESEIKFLLGILPQHLEGQVVFSHNDLHPSNILLHEKKTFKIKLIDFEYASYNYRGYDIANFFNESMFNYEVKECPYYALQESNYPNKEQILDFIKYYTFFSHYCGQTPNLTSIEEGDKITNITYPPCVDNIEGKCETDSSNSEEENHEDTCLLLQDEKSLRKYVESKHDIAAFNNDVLRIYEQAQICTLLSHYYWIIWSIIKSKNPDIKFDYVKYAYDRYKIYQKLRTQYIEKKGKNEGLGEYNSPNTIMNDEDAKGQLCDGLKIWNNDI